MAEGEGFRALGLKLGVSDLELEVWWLGPRLQG